MTNGHRGTVQPPRPGPSHPGPSHPGPSPPGTGEAGAPDRLKAAARAAAAARRDALEGRAAAGPALCERALAAIPWPAGCAVSAYWPMRSEIDPRPLMAALHARGHAIGLPVMRGAGQPLAFRDWAPGLALVPGGYGTKVPGPERPEVVPAVLLVPLLAFDRSGYRLGYGGGFYDRTLAALRAGGPVLAVGLAHAGQEVAEVPRDGHDQRLEWIVTEAEAMKIG